MKIPHTTTDKGEKKEDTGSDIVEMGRSK